MTNHNLSLASKPWAVLGGAGRVVWAGALLLSIVCGGPSAPVHAQGLAADASENADAARREEASPDFQRLCDGESFAGWQHDGNWVMDGDAFYRARSGGPLTYVEGEVPDDFELRFQWKVSPGCNSGVYYRPGQVEYQILDNQGSPYGENPRQAAAALFFCMAPSKDATREVGQWNTGRIVCKGTVIQHWLNGEKVVDFDYTDPRWAEMVRLLEIRGGDLTGRGGRLWLQDHGQPVWFRDLELRSIGPGESVVAGPDFRPLPIPPAALQKEQQRVQNMLRKRK